jgi:signal peptidase II
LRGNARKWLMILPLAGMVLGLDQWSKAWVVRNIPLNEVWVPFPAISKFFWFKHVTNTGAAFGIFPNSRPFLLAVSVVVIVAIIAYSRYFSAERWLASLSMGLQLGGALGNFLDRLRFGSVVDFLDVPYWPTFNVADSSLIVGTLLLALLVLSEKEEIPAQELVDA